MDPYQPDSNYIGQILLKPSVDLIPDEFEHNDNLTASVHIFHGHDLGDEENTKAFSETLMEIGFNVPESNVHDIRNRKQVLDDLKSIATEASGKSSLIILFMGSCKENTESFICKETNEVVATKDVWINFIASNCPDLKDKPKIFLFLAAKFVSPVQRDGAAYADMERYYELPSPSDILIVFKKIEGLSFSQRTSFIQNLCYNIKENSKTDDIINLITHTEEESGQQPVIISTLTRKFYLTCGEPRGHQLHLDELHSNLELSFRDLNEKVEKLGAVKVVKKQEVIESLVNGDGKKEKKNGRQRKDGRAESSSNGSSISGGSGVVKKRASSVTEQPKVKNQKKRPLSLLDRPPWK